MLRKQFALPVLAATALCAQSVPQLLSTISGTTLFGQSILSRDGHWLAWTVSLRNPDNTVSRNSEIWLLDLSKPGASPKRLNEAKPHAEQSAVFSPDSKQIAFLSDG